MATITEVKPNSSSGASGSFKTGFKIKEFLYLCLSKWYWFVISIAVCLAGAFVYIKRSTPVYKKEAAILISTDSQKKAVSESASLFEDLGISSNIHMADEVQILRSPDLMRDVVRNLNLETKYTAKGRLRTVDLYGKNLPIQVIMHDVKEDDKVSFTLNYDKNGNFIISNISVNKDKVSQSPIKGRIGSKVKTPFGMIEVIPGNDFEESNHTEIQVSHNSVKATASALVKNLEVTDEPDGYNLVSLKFTNTSPERATDVLNQLIASYNDKWMKERRTSADNSSKFIDERVQLLQDELGMVDDDISAFKSANMVPNVDAAATLYMSQANQSMLELKDLKNQEYMAKYIRSYLKNPDNQYNMLPANLSLTNTGLSSQISLYNTKIMERNTLISQSSASNPLVTQLDQTLTYMRDALMASIDNEIVSLGEQIRSQEGFGGNAASKIASNPQQAKYLLSVERQQKVKEQLYLYLLQKREENELSQAFTSNNTRIVREPDGSDAPISPVKGNIYLIAFAIGLAIPALILFEREISVHYVRGRNDIKGMKIPLAGELPLHSKKQKLKKVSPNNKDPRPNIVVKENSRNSVNEAFRVLRTNIEFMLGNSKDSKVIMLTSANPGSGKTFVSYNVAKAFALKGKKVVVIDLDLRKASLSKYIDENSKGIADYLANRINDMDSIVRTVADTPNLSVIPVGTIPPNPTELLYSESLSRLIDDLKAEYDYVFIDCPPIELVADASIISKFADYTLFVIRAGVLDLSMLSVIDEMYETGKYPNMSLVLNGTINPNNSYSRRYGNPYSYGYGYGVGYSSED